VPRRKAQGDLEGELDILNSDEPHEEAELLLSAEVTGSLRPIPVCHRWAEKSFGGVKKIEKRTLGPWMRWLASLASARRL
jgi:hypothetical protein